MAYTYPLSRANFLAKLPISEMTFFLTESNTQSIARTGEIMTSIQGSRLWTGTITVAPELHRDGRAWQSLINLVKGPGKPFECYARDSDYPRMDPNGTALGSATPTLAAVSLDGTTATIQGLPANYRLRMGDMFSIVYSSTKLGLHEIAEDVQANGSGVTGNMTFSPPLREGAAVGNPVTLYRPYCIAVVKPGSFRPANRRGPFSDGMMFDWIQVLRW